MPSIVCRRAFSLVELIAAAVIVAVVAAATVATITPMRAKAHQRLIREQLAALNALSHEYLGDQGQYPPNGVESLIVAGYLPDTGPDQQSINRGFRRDFRYDSATGIFAKR